MGSTTIVRSATAHGIAPDAPPPDAVREQLSRILASPLFRSSKHYPSFLKHVVEQTLAGRAAGLKERALGMEVFGRDPHYDTNADPVVRTSACEVRKRIAQYYHEPGRESEIRIELPAGSYVPEFHFPEPRAVEIAAPAPVARPRPAAAVPPASRTHRQRYLLAAAVVLAAVILTAAALAAGLGRSKTPAEQFWDPVWSRTDTVLVCLGVSRNLPKDGTPPPVDPTHRQVMWNDRVAFADAVTMAKLTGLLQAHGKQYDIRGSSTLTLEDMQKTPAVLIGAFDNPWTMALSHQLRFNFEYDAATGRPVIRDRQNPSRVLWRGDFTRPYSQVTEDYAIVSRYHDPQAERIMVVVAGMGKDGTAAAGEFVTDSRYLEKLTSVAPPGWERKNLQVVLATEVINGNSGPPRVLATYFW
jgi:hypothetical protein